MSISPLQRGFSHIPRQKKSCHEEEYQPKKELVISDQQDHKETHKYDKTNKPKQKRRVRRGGACKKSNVSQKYVGTIKIFSTNGAGIKNGKVASLIAEVQNTQANIVTVQETHCT